ncbi:MAG: DUF6236 family protein [Mycobacteriaceae bacterium]
MVSYIGLYYPFIHFRNEGWLKSTALYWDGMRRIVPSGASVHDTDEVKRLLDAGFIQNKAPLDATFQVATPFRELIAVHGDTLAAQLSVAQRDMWPDDMHTKLYAHGRDTKLAYVFDEQMEPSLLSDLFGHGLVASRSDNPRWIGMHPKLAQIYMLSLAEEMANRLGAHPLTDEIFDHVAVSGLTMDRLAAVLLDQSELVAPASANAGAEREIEEAMVSLAFRNVVPTHPERIPAEKIIEFRKTYAEERGLFQAELANLTGSLAYLHDVKDLHEVEEHLKNEYDKTLAPRLQRLRKGLHSANIDTVESATAVSLAFPAAIATALMAVGFTLAPPATAVAGLAFAAWTIIRKRNKAVGGLLKPSPEAYLYRVSKLSTPKTVTSEISANSRKFLVKAR